MKFTNCRVAIIGFGGTELRLPESLVQAIQVLMVTKPLIAIKIIRDWTSFDLVTCKRICESNDILNYVSSNSYYSL